MRAEADLVKGWTAPGYEPVRAAFAAGFAASARTREIGAAVAAYRRGRCVLSLWSGDRAPGGGAPWTEDTLINVWSASKGAVAIAVAQLVGRGQLTYADKVASVWPEFAEGGKGEITIAQVMSHEAGLPGFAEPTRLEDQFDWDACCAKLARQSPVWPPGSVTSYHAMTFGWLAGEIVRRVTGRPFGQVLRDDLAGPAGADIHVGLAAEHEGRVAQIVGPAPASPSAAEPPPPIALMAVTNPVQDPEAPNRREWRAAEIPAANAQASAVGLARLYAAALPSGLSGVRLLPGAALQELLTPAAPAGRRDLLQGFVGGWGRGVMLNPGQAYGPGAKAFGHTGWGGAFGCADPNLDLSIGYVCNQMGSEILLDDRSVRLSRTITACASAT